MLNYVPITGVVHVGAHEAQELAEYGDAKTLWIEPMPEYAEKLRSRGLDVVEAAIDEVEQEVDFYVTTYDQGSSYLRPIDHEVGAKIVVKTLRLDGMDLEGFNCLVVDTQGSEDRVIRSAGDKISQFDLVIAEGSDRSRYEDGVQTVDLIILMNSLGFKLVDYKEHEQSLIKDCVFIKCQEQ